MRALKSAQHAWTILGILAAFILGGAPAALGVPWQVDPAVISEAMAQHLAERYPQINGPADLENLLRDIGRRRQLLRLAATFAGGIWHIGGETAALITEIDVEMVTRLLKQPVNATVQNYLGQVDSPEIQLKVRSVIKKYMQRRGYPGSKVSLTSHPEGDGIGYDVVVGEGDPCVFDRVELGFKLPTTNKLDLKPGDLCDVDEIESATANLETQLRDRGYNQVRLELANLAYHPEKGTATVYISGVLGQRVHYDIVDSSHRFLIDDLFPDDELTKIDPSIVGPDAMSAELQRRYRNHGFLDAAVRGPDIRKASEDEFVYVFYVDPGKQYILKSVQFEGVTIFKEQDMLDAMGLESLWQTARPYNYEELQKGLVALRARYQDAGYWDVKIRDPGLGQRDKETGTVRQKVQVEEGLPRILQSVATFGNVGVSTPTIVGLLGSDLGEPLNRANLVDFEKKVREAYINQGYMYADVNIDLKANETKRALMVTLTVKVTEGTRVRIGEITIVGLVHTREKVVRRELLFHSGDWYDPERIAQSQQALNRLGIFRSVHIGSSDRNAVSDKVREIDLTVDVREGKPGNVSFGPGWDLNKGWNYGAEAAYNNIGGVGRQASIRGSISEERDQYAIGPHTLLGRQLGTGYTEPWIFDVPVDATIRAKQQASWYGELWDLSYGGEVEFKHKLQSLLPGSSVSVFYGQKIAKSEGSSVEKDDLLIASDERIGDAGPRFNIDRRDDLKFPTTGYTFDSELAWARYELGGDTRFFRSDLSTSRYFGLSPTWVIALGVGVTAYDNIQRKGDRPGILPAQERLLSGTDTVRGYPPNSLGPRARAPIFTVNQTTHGCNVAYDSTTSLNGTSRTAIKTELRHKFTDSFAVNGFIDNGNVFLSNDQMRKFSTAYNGPTADKPAECKAVTGERSVEDNFGYDYEDLAKNPGYLWTRHYYGYGTSFSLLTALGSVNLSYGLPWREPVSDKCTTDANYCIPREAGLGLPWWRRGQFNVNVGARF